MNLMIGTLIHSKEISEKKSFFTYLCTLDLNLTSSKYTKVYQAIGKLIFLPFFEKWRVSGHLKIISSKYIAARLKTFMLKYLLFVDKYLILF